MFRNNYQGGAVVELFSGQGKDPVAKWKLCGGPSAIYKEYNKEVKGFVYCLEGSSQTVKIQMPENGKMSLGLLQRYLVLQVNVPQCSDFSAELGITDSEHLKRRLHLSTVHKELSVTLLHAKIPFTGLKRNVWSTVCIDLESLTSELFKGFLTLDSIAVFATCRVRRIFTMKTDPIGMPDDGLIGARPIDLIPRSCQYPPDVTCVVLVVNMENLQKADLRVGLYSADSDQSVTAGSSPYQRTRPQGVLYTPSGSSASGPPPQTERKIKGLCQTNQKVTTQSHSIINHSDNLTNEESTHILQKDAVSESHKMRSKRQECAPPSSKEKISLQPLTITEMSEHQTADESCSHSKEISALNPTELFPIQPGLSSDIQVWSSWESNEGSEPQLTLQEEVFTYSSQPHSPKRGQGQGEQEKLEMQDDQTESKRRSDAQPEDDFIGSESDEDNSCTMHHYKNPRVSSPASPQSSRPVLSVQIVGHPESLKVDKRSPKDISLLATSMQPPSTGRAEPERVLPVRCFSPSGQEHMCITRETKKVTRVLDVQSSVSLCRRLLQEVKLGDSKQCKEEDESLVPVNCNPHDLHLLGSLQMQDDEELRMLASLKREQEEDECQASGLSVSKIQQCNVSVSMSSEDTSTWTNVLMVSHQGHHYQKEMNPLLQSNPREWMDVLSPPIMPSSQQRRSGNNGDHLVGGEDASANEEENEEKYLNLLYDPCLNCYYDPETGKYYWGVETGCEGVGRMSEQKAGLRLHPGIIASVIFVSVAAVAAAVLIIRKYCFPVNEVTYRYSVLRRMEDQQSLVTEEEGDRGPGTVGEESDEELLE
ncbi:protein CFAP20DC [Pholidichthys leucotaenia]